MTFVIDIHGPQGMNRNNFAHLTSLFMLQSYQTFTLSTFFFFFLKTNVSILTCYTKNGIWLNLPFPCATLLCPVLQVLVIRLQ